MAEIKQHNFRLVEPVAGMLDRLKEKWGCDKTSIVEMGIRLFADKDLGAILGGGLMATEQALRCWAAVLEQAGAENADWFTRAEWNLIADANNGCSPLVFTAGEDLRVSRPTTMLWANVADAIRLDDLAAKWEVADPDGLVKRLRELDVAHAWAMVTAVQWFWEYCGEPLNHTVDAWWTPEFRRSAPGLDLSL